MNIKKEVLERFLRYIAIDTQSDPQSETYPSTAKQLDLLNLLRDELLHMGLSDAAIDGYGYVTATVPPTKGCENKPVIGFIAHADTSPDMKGSGIRPQIIENYAGGDIPLNDRLVMTVADFPELSFFKGHTLITTDGTTLLGADDKAGIAEIMTAAAWLLEHPEIPHGPIRIGFTPDEEIGGGVDHFDVKAFGAQFAYTVDGGFEGELEYENFNAASARITVQGRNIHPGYAKDKMINALEAACAFNALLPACQRPEHTEGYEGFFHLTALNGTVEEARMEYIVRDHDRGRFEEKKRLLEQTAAFLNARYGEEIFVLTLKDQYYNMRERVEPHPELIAKACQAMEEAGVTPIVRPIRGGTDGSRLSYMGLPCPNLFAGGMNFHGKYEYCSLDSMEKATLTLLNLCKLWAE